MPDSSRTSVLMTPKGLLLAILLAILALFLLNPRNLEEYVLFFTQSRPASSLPFDEISQDWTEKAVIERLAPIRVKCVDSSPETSLGDRTCFSDVQEHNGITTLVIAFHFSDGLLNHVVVTMPFWVHRSLKRFMFEHYGRPDATQKMRFPDDSLYGWRLKSGAAMFMNQDQPLSPIGVNMVLWTSPRKCSEQNACIHQR